jgi:hypothetical protein
VYLHMLCKKLKEALFAGFEKQLPAIDLKLYIYFYTNVVLRKKFGSEDGCNDLEKGLAIFALSIQNN